MLSDMLGVDQGHDAVQRHMLADFIIDEEGCCNGGRVCQPAGLDEDVVELVLSGKQFLQDLDQVVAHVDEAADAAVLHLVDLFLRGEHQVRVDIHLAELVLDHGDAVAVPFSQYVVQKRRLPGTEKAGQDGDGNFAVLKMVGLHHCLVSLALVLSAFNTCSGVIG